MKRDSEQFLSSHLADLLVERGLNQAFLDAVEQHRRFQLPIVVTRNDQPVSLPVEQVQEEINRTRTRIAELDAQIAREESPFSLNETPPQG
jgi:uncharacterized radical SAM superfamily Fe-S cluster-containing enzyme